MTHCEHLYDSVYSHYNGCFKTHPPSNYDVGYATFNSICQIFLNITQDSGCHDPKVTVHGGIILINCKYYYVMANDVPMVHGKCYEKYFPAFLYVSSCAEEANTNISNYACISQKSLVQVNKCDFNASCLYPNTSNYCNELKCTTKPNKNTCCCKKKNYCCSKYKKQGCCCKKDSCKKKPVCPNYYKGCSETIFLSENCPGNKFFYETLTSTIICGLTGQVLLVDLGCIKVIGIVIYLESCNEFHIALTNSKVCQADTKYSKSYYNVVKCESQIAPTVTYYCNYLSSN
jgi:hypothetical protein